MQRGEARRFATRTSVTGAELTISDEATLRTLALDGHCQSEVVLLRGGGLSMAQPLELVKIMCLVTLGWLSGSAAESLEAPRVLLLGLGGGSIARVLSATMPPMGWVHSVELEPEVIQAAVDYFGLVVRDRCCTVEAGEAGTFLRRHHRAISTPKRLTNGGECSTADDVGSGEGGVSGGGDGRVKTANTESGDAASSPADARNVAEEGMGTAPRSRFDVILLDAFTSDGLSVTTQQRATLHDAAHCLTDRGILLINLHTGDLDDPDYYVARRVLRLLCERFGSVYRVLCTSTQNLIAICHQGDFLDAEAWQARLQEVLNRPTVAEACTNFELDTMMSRFDFVGGIGSPMSDDDEEKERELGLKPRE